ncbi:MAG: hypothetical protein QOD29_2117, partial [Alphaproteobacteria bacterium]|nr:hypothetical protein [Alphaproteobacteria bacterium]
AIHDLLCGKKGVDGRDKHGHDETTWMPATSAGMTRWDRFHSGVTTPITTIPVADGGTTAGPARTPQRQ